MVRDGSGAAGGTPAGQPPRRRRYDAGQTGGAAIPGNDWWTGGFT
jgi:hypothetical protein